MVEVASKFQNAFAPVETLYCSHGTLKSSSLPCFRLNFSKFPANRGGGAVLCLSCPYSYAADAMKSILG